MLAVATPLLAGQVVDAITASAPFSIVLQLAILIAVIAVAEAGLGLWQRWLSARIGEGLILDLRRAVFDHVLTMPIAFFTRTRTGALVSRLNNDVVGAQRAFSETLSGVVSNLVALVLALAAMLYISWQITVLALLLLPVFVIPARRMGRRLAAAAAGERQPQRRDGQPDDRAVLRAGRDPGQAVRPSRAGVRGVRRAGDPGPRHRGAQRHGADDLRHRLTLVSALALALVYGLGGWFALQGTLEAGAVVSLALLLTRLYAPLTSLASARVEVMSALVSFERVFEVLDLKPLITGEARTPPTVPDRPGVGRVRRTSASPTRRPTRSPWPRSRRSPRWTPAAGSRSSTTCRSGSNRARWSRWSVPPGAGKSTMAQLLARLYDVDEGAVRLGGVDLRDLSFAAVRETLGMVTQDGHLFHESVRREPAARPTGGQRGGPLERAAPGPARHADRLAAGRPGHRGGRARLPAVRR